MMQLSRATACVCRLQMVVYRRGWESSGFGPRWLKTTPLMSERHEFLLQEEEYVYLGSQVEGEIKNRVQEPQVEVPGSHARLPIGEQGCRRSSSRSGSQVTCSLSRTAWRK